jgi:hypothetical protein
VVRDADTDDGSSSGGGAESRALLRAGSLFFSPVAQETNKKTEATKMQGNQYTVRH